jgi:Uma2 family endonuclease
MTVAEFDAIPNPPGGRNELYHGELVFVAYPKRPHVRAQMHLRRLLEGAAGEVGIVKEEMPFCPLPEHECWSADVALVLRDRWEAIDDWLAGAPELVIEVLSPSNRATEIRDKRQICLANGAKQFWAVDTSLRQVDVSTPDGHTVTYRGGAKIPLFFGGSIAVDDIFR